MDNSEFISSFARRLDIDEGRAVSMIRHISDLKYVLSYSRPDLHQCQADGQMMK